MGKHRSESELPDWVRVRYTHVRLLDDEGVVKPRGGYTVCRFWNTETDQLIAAGYGFCSKRDTFNKRLGRTISFGRALNQFEGMEGIL